MKLSLILPVFCGLILALTPEIQATPKSPEASEAEGSLEALESISGEMGDAGRMLIAKNVGKPTVHRQDKIIDDLAKLIRYGEKLERKNEGGDPKPNTARETRCQRCEKKKEACRLCAGDGKKKNGKAGPGEGEELAKKSYTRHGGPANGLGRGGASNGESQIELREKEFEKGKHEGRDLIEDEYQDLMDSVFKAMSGAKERE